MHKAHQQWLEAASSQGGHQSQCDKTRMIIMKIHENSTWGFVSPSKADQLLEFARWFTHVYPIIIPLKKQRFWLVTNSYEMADVDDFIPPIFWWKCHCKAGGWERHQFKSEGSCTLEIQRTTVSEQLTSNLRLRNQGFATTLQPY